MDLNETERASANAISSACVGFHPVGKMDSAKFANLSTRELGALHPIGFAGLNGLATR